jgi:hypothetical protein
VSRTTPRASEGLWRTRASTQSRLLAKSRRGLRSKPAEWQRGGGRLFPRNFGFNLVVVVVRPLPSIPTTAAAAAMATVLVVVMVVEVRVPPPPGRRCRVLHNRRCAVASSWRAVAGSSLLRTLAAERTLALSLPLAGFHTVPRPPTQQRHGPATPGRGNRDGRFVLEARIHGPSRQEHR